ncbi:MAG: bifunctional diguanylate cyclase/phosphodiesterase [Kordiimonadaceae bacterium]|nr:bifunctional diguanylate cyclase/phosphodiesterase [Kordiimonadaceae bacterium]
MKEPIQNDPVTGLPGRDYLWSILGDTLNQVKRNASYAAVLFVQVDELATLRDAISIEAGNAFLKLISARIKNSLWDMDSAVHFETDKFVIVANSIQNPEDVHIIMNKVHNYLSLECEISGQTISPTVNIGIVLLPEDALEVDEIMSNSGIALQMARARQDYAYCYYNQELGSEIEDQQSIKKSILETLADQRFLLMLQPKINVKSGKVSGVEALVRMRDNEGNIVNPTEFLQVAEKSTLIAEIGSWVLGRVSEIIEEWQKSGINIPISINISDMEFKGSAKLLSALYTLSEVNRENPGKIILEINENSITHDVELAVALMQEIKSYGFQLSLDKFGSGLSSLSILKDLKIDEIKIARGFLEDVPSNKRNTAIFESIIHLGHSLDLRVVAMGVETASQLEILKTAGCDEYQGFLISKPMEETDFITWHKNMH